MRFIITSVRFFVFLPPVFLFTSLHFSLVLYSMHCVWVFPWYSSSCLSPQSNLFLYCCCRVFFSFASIATKDRRKKCWEAKKMYKNSQATGKFYVHFIIYTFQMNSIGETTFFFASLCTSKIVFNTTIFSTHTVALCETRTSHGCIYDSFTHTRA